MPFWRKLKPHKTHKVERDYGDDETSGTEPEGDSNSDDSESQRSGLPQELIEEQKASDVLMTQAEKKKE